MDSEMWPNDGCITVLGETETPFITDNNLRIKTCRGGLDEVRVSFCTSHESIIIQGGNPLLNVNQ